LSGHSDTKRVEPRLNLAVVTPQTGLESDYLNHRSNRCCKFKNEDRFLDVVGTDLNTALDIGEMRMSLNGVAKGIDAPGRYFYLFDQGRAVMDRSGIQEAGMSQCPMIAIMFSATSRGIRLRPRPRAKW